MHEDEEGFLYPCINKTLCIDCHLCEKVCPVINIGKPKRSMECYAARNPNLEKRKNSSSGGVFSMLAETIIGEGGVVFGARFDDNWVLKHDYIETYEGIKDFMGSKYVQSYIGESYKQALDFLNLGRKVLFTGTPCQISGLKLYLRDDFENLLTVDFICHGVPSPGVFRWYLKEELFNYTICQNRKKTVLRSTVNSTSKEEVFASKKISIKDIRFRDKREGWKKYSFFLHFAETSADGKQNTVSFSTIAAQNSYMKGFLNNLYLRPSCYSCPAKSLSSSSDLTIADYWRVERIHPILDDDMGVSAVIVNTERGGYYCKLYCNDWTLSDVRFVKKYNSALDKSTSMPTKRADFYKRWKYEDFNTLITDLCKKTHAQIFFSKLKSLYILLKK